MKNYLVTGAAGFIGFHLCKRLLDRGDAVIGVDNLNDYYSTALKLARLEQLTAIENFRFLRADISDRQAVERFFALADFDVVMHMAAQAGVRYSIENANAYADSNLLGFVNILEACRHSNTAHLIYASSSSVYGANTKQPFSVTDAVDRPVSLYAATKRANELMAHAYSHLYSFRTTGIRFFTVYGPWGRPDMAIFGFAEAILAQKPIRIFNHGRMKRDFTFIDDAADAVIRLADSNHFPQPVDAYLRGSEFSRVHNLGSNRPVPLETMIGLLELELGKRAIREYVDMQPGDVKETFADTSDLNEAINFAPSTPIEVGIARFAKWFRWYSDVYLARRAVSVPRPFSPSTSAPVRID